MKVESETLEDEIGKLTSFLDKAENRFVQYQCLVLPSIVFNNKSYMIACINHCRRQRSSSFWIIKQCVYLLSARIKKGLRKPATKKSGHHRKDSACPLHEWIEWVAHSRMCGPRSGLSSSRPLLLLSSDLHLVQMKPMPQNQSFPPDSTAGSFHLLEYV